jgi:hypothetical protein
MIFYIGNIINGLTEKEIKIPFEKKEVCEKCFLYKMSVINLHNFRIFDYHTGNKVKCNIPQFQLNPNANIPKNGYPKMIREIFPTTIGFFVEK